MISGPHGLSIRGEMVDSDSLIAFSGSSLALYLFFKYASVEKLLSHR